MRKIGLLLLIFGYLGAVLPGSSQTVLWSEDFGTCSSGCSAATYSGANGAWTVTITGPNGADANMWYVSGEECGNASGACGTACASDASLHVSTSPTVLGDLGAAYLAGGSGFWFVEASARVESPTIDLTGQSNVTLTFNYIEDYVGQSGYDPDDHATLWYYDGSTWAQIDPLAITPAGCQPQGTWDTYSALLPASANNNPNVRIGFEWVNDDDNVGTDPSFAVDDIELTVPSSGPLPVASFTPSNTTICEGDCVTFTDNSTSSNSITNWDWTFQSGTPATASSQNPGSVCWSTAGTYDVTLTVTDANGTDDTTVQITVNNCSQPIASFTPSQTSFCEGDCITFTDNSSSSAGITNWDWTFQGGNPATGSGQNPGSVCWSTAGTYDVTLTVTDPNGTDDTTVQVTVTTCAGPVASFTPSQTTLCEGDCISFTDNSTSSAGIASWDWDFSSGGNPTTGTGQNPGQSCYANSGSYDITLTITDNNGDTDDTTVTVTVTTCNPPVADFSFPTPICEGDCIQMTDESTGPPTSWDWTITNGTPTSSTDQNPTICFNNAGTATIKLVVCNGFGCDSLTQTVTVGSTPNVTATGSATIEPGESTVISFTGDTTGTSYVWSPSTGLSCTQCTSATASPSSSTTYVITVTDTASGCQATSAVFIEVVVPFSIGVPTGFSPDNDGFNDELHVLGEGIDKMTFKVYNRYGQKVFETTDQDEGWDGTHNGTPVNPGVFAWVLEYNFTGMPVEVLKGTVTLVR